MPARALRLTRPALLRARELEAIEGMALRLLEELGIEIAHPELALRARRHGFRLEHARIRLPRKQVLAYLDGHRTNPPSPRRRSVGKVGGTISLHVSTYPQTLHDPESGEIVPLTRDRLTETAKLVEVLRGRDLEPAIPGCPTDVPAPLQPLSQYRIAVETISGPTRGVDAKHLDSLPYLMEMAEAAGDPVRSLPVYVYSPLRLGGESLDTVMAFASRLDHTVVAAMPSAGCTAPVRPVEAFALAAAEVVGSALILSECLDLTVEYSVGLYPIDLRGLAMSFGAPESLLFQAMSNEVDAYFHGAEWWPGVDNIHCLAKLPGPQAAAEKMSILLLGALWGGRHFYGAGALSLDEVFSAIQLLTDLEIRDHVARVLRGADTTWDADACLQDVRDGLEQGFAGLDRTRGLFRDLYWHPRLFERRFLGAWQATGSPAFESEARQLARELIAQHNYEAPVAVRRKLAAIYQRAESELA